MGGRRLQMQNISICMDWEGIIRNTFEYMIGREWGV
jgi:hypothetical protein